MNLLLTVALFVLATLAAWHAPQSADLIFAIAVLLTGVAMFAR